MEIVKIKIKVGKYVWVKSVNCYAVVKVKPFISFRLFLLTIHCIDLFKVAFAKAIALPHLFSMSVTLLDLLIFKIVLFSHIGN